MEEMKFCPKCGSLVKSSDEFCPKCGYNLKKDYQKEINLNKRIDERDRKYNNDRFHSQQATMALMFGILSFLYIGIIFGPLAIYFGNKERKYDSYAKVGFVLGIIGTSISAIEIILTVVLFFSMFIGL